MAARDPKIRSHAAAIAAHTKALAATDRSELTKAARKKSPFGIDYWLERVDPLGEMPDDERRARARSAQGLYQRQMGLRSAQARAKKREERQKAEREKVEQERRRPVEEALQAVLTGFATPAQGAA